jgi:hypothetical protein
MQKSDHIWNPGIDLYTNYTIQLTFIFFMQMVIRVYYAGFQLNQI